MSEKNLMVKDKNENMVKAEPVSKDRRIFTPDVDICEDEDKFVIFADMPGVSKDNINIDFEEGELKIYGKTDEVSKEYTPLLSEYSLGDYSRVFRIPDGIDAENISAVIKNGLLKVELPKHAKLKKRKIEIK